jgi:predicted  nucleic acid-binding Zn-ribbon protein
MPQDLDALLAELDATRTRADETGYPVITLEVEEYDALRAALRLGEQREAALEGMVYQFEKRDAEIRAAIDGKNREIKAARRKALEEAGLLVMNIHDSGVENRAKRDLCRRIARKLSALAHEGVS